MAIVLIKRAEEDLRDRGGKDKDTHTEEVYANTEAEIVLMWPYAKNAKEC